MIGIRVLGVREAGGVTMRSSLVPRRSGKVHIEPLLGSTNFSPPVRDRFCACLVARCPILYTDPGLYHNVNFRIFVLIDPFTLRVFCLHYIPTHNSPVAIIIMNPNHTGSCVFSSAFLIGSYNPRDVEIKLGISHGLCSDCFLLRSLGACKYLCASDDKHLKTIS